MKCGACKKKVVFGSIRGDTWQKVVSGEWLLGPTPPPYGILGDCPACGLRLEWEEGEAPPDRAATLPLRVHLSALREQPAKFAGLTITLRAIMIRPAGSKGYLSDSWKARPKAGVEEADADALVRLAREQTPRIEAELASADAEARFNETALLLADGGSRAAWIEAIGGFDGTVFRIATIQSVWPPRA